MTREGLSRALDAEMSATAISGIGVLSWPIQQYLDYTLTFDTDGEKWDYTKVRTYSCFAWHMF